MNDTAKQEDRRTRYTKSVIHEAFFELLGEKGFERMSVTDLCKRAEINRGTFYLHYVDKFALLEEVIDVMLDEEPPFEERLHTLCQRVPTKDEYRLLYTNPNTFAFVSKRVIERAKPQMVPQIIEKTGLPEEVAEMLLVFSATGNMAVNNSLGWKRSKKFNQMQALFREFTEGGLAHLKGAARTENSH